MKQRYYSKVDAWLFIALAAPLIALVLFFTVPEDPLMTYGVSLYPLLLLLSAT